MREGLQLANCCCQLLSSGMHGLFQPRIIVHLQGLTNTSKKPSFEQCYAQSKQSPAIRLDLAEGPMHDPSGHDVAATS